MSVTIADLVRIYRQLRDQKAELKAQIREIDEDLEKLEAVLLQMMDESGAQHVRTQYGTVFQATKESYSIEDWDAVREWIIANNCVEVLTKRLSSTVVRELEEDGAEIPGVTKNVVRTVRIRK